MRDPVTGVESNAPRRAVIIAANGAPRQVEGPNGSVTFVPLEIRRRHTRKLLVPPAGSKTATMPSAFDLPLLRTLGKAYYWQRLLDHGEAKDATDIARRYQLDKGWVSEVLRLTRLAPDIVQAIVEGRQPRHLNLHQLRGRGADVPLDWKEQRVVFGFR
jgi:hypothetical protein